MKLTTKVRKKFRIRNKLKNVSKSGRLRLTVSRSSKNISAQIIDENKNITIDASYIREKLKDIIQDEDLSRYIL